MSSKATPSRLNTAPWKIQSGYGLFLIPFIFLAAAIPPRFDGLYGQDAYAYYNYAVGALRDFLVQGEPFPAFFWPPGYPLLVALVSFVVGKTPVAGQIVSLAAAALVPIFTYLLAKELRPHDKRVAFAAALLVACTGQLWQSALVVMTDTTGLAFATCGMWAVARYGRTQRGRWLILAAAALAYALLTRWGYGLVAIPATLYALVVTVSSSGFQVSGFKFQDANRSISQSLSLLLIAALTVLLIMSPVLYAVLTPQIDPISGHTAFTGDLGVYSWNPLNAFRSQFQTADGLLSYRFPTGLFYALTPAFPYYFTPWLAWLIFPGVWRLLKECAAAPLFLIIGWAAVVIGFHIGAPYQNFRFALAYLPPLAIAAAVGLASISQPSIVTSEQSPIHHPPFHSRTSRLTHLFFVIGLLLMVISGLRLINTYITNKDRDLATITWVESQAKSDANLISFGLTLTFQQYSHLSTYEIFYLEPPDMTRLLSEERPTYLFVDVNNVQQQWSELAPGLNYTWLEQHATLRVIGQIDAYTLFQVSDLP